MEKLSRLNLFEASSLDQERLIALVDQMGEAAAERLVGQALEQIAIGLNKAERAYAKGDFAVVDRNAANIASVAAEVGLVSLRRVARDVRDALTQGDSAAIGATTARLIRVGESSLMSVWDVQDVSL